MVDFWCQVGAENRSTIDSKRHRKSDDILKAFRRRLAGVLECLRAVEAGDRTRTVEDGAARRDARRQGEKNLKNLEPSVQHASLPRDKPRGRRI